MGTERNKNWVSMGGVKGTKTCKIRKVGIVRGTIDCEMYQALIPNKIVQGQLEHWAARGDDGRRGRARGVENSGEGRGDEKESGEDGVKGVVSSVRAVPVNKQGEKQKVQ